MRERKIIKLTESDLIKIVRKVIKEEEMNQNLPTKEMLDWFDTLYYPTEDMDYFDRQMWYVETMEDFFYEFEEELSGLGYDDKIVLFDNTIEDMFGLI